MQSALRGLAGRLLPRPLVGVGTEPRLGLIGQVACMSLWKSKAVRDWVDTQNPKKYKARLNPLASNEYMMRKNKYLSPFLSRRQQAHKIKDAIFAGEIKLEPTVMVPPPKFKGHKRVDRAAAKKLIIAEKMAQMPAMIAEYREARRAAAAKKQRDKYFKSFIG
uniref:MRPL25 domain-containing protein n=1 Tax=Haptolina ericina TaxID=156174 RepID=A0A7S3AWK2_9EUKA|mmetsp:Transcript_39766/g.90149  ORF Transcript_39766/g.90149 Transcript_39766/m.90149 type:complete len:163 (+) Transcript_39766:32-520(+)